MTRKKVLLVDDSSTVLLMEKMLLGRAAYDVITAADGAEAVDKARREAPDIILLDLVMPNVDGFEALKRLKSDETTRGIPVIMVTTKSETDKVQTAFALGCADFTTKPIDGPDLLAKIKKLVGP
jgi:CheY-like chemotaxis protein